MKVSSRQFFVNGVKPNLDRDDLLKRRFKAYQLIEYIPHNLEPIECLLIAVDFDKELFILRPFPDETRLINNDDFYVQIQQCRIAGHKIKAV